MNAWDGRLRFTRRAHQRIRADVHGRDDFTCQNCGYRPPAESIPADYDGKWAVGTWRVPGGDRVLCIDHIRPRSRGGQPSLENLQTLCEPCNLAKSARAAA